MLESNTGSQAYYKDIGMKFLACPKQQAIQILHLLLSHWECTKKSFLERAGTFHGWQQPQAHALLRLKQVLHWLEWQQVLTSLSSWAKSLSLGCFASEIVRDRQQLGEVSDNARIAETLPCAVLNGTTLAFISQSNSG